MSPGSPRKLAVLIALALAALAAGGCRQPQMMADQPQYDPLESSRFFPDGSSSRPRVEGTVSRMPIIEASYATTGKVGTAFGDGFPSPVTTEMMQRGRERFDIYCSMCHGRTGYGDGMIVRRGYRTPPSFHRADIRTRKTGYMFDVITNGYGSMPAYGSMVPVEDRWAIIAYVRALQLSQSASINDVLPSERGKLEQGGGATTHGSH